MAPQLTTEQKTRIVEWFLQRNLIVTVQRQFKNQYKCKEAPARKTVKTLVGAAVSHNWEYGRQEKGREQATCSHARHRWDHSCECGLTSSTKSVPQLAAENEVSPSTARRILGTDLRTDPYKIHVFQSLTTVCREKRTRFAEEFGHHLQKNPHTPEHIWF